jgi:hypothetical protein
MASTLNVSRWPGYVVRYEGDAPSTFAGWVPDGADLIWMSRNRILLLTRPPGRARARLMTQGTGTAGVTGTPAANGPLRDS